MKLLFKSRLRQILPTAFAALIFNGTIHAQPPGLTPPQDHTDTVAWERYFATWETRTPDDAQLWIDRFNHYFGLSRRTGIVLQTADTEPQPGASGERIMLTDSAGVEVGYLTERTDFDDGLFTKAIAAIDRGIALHPDRLDMLLGRAAALRFAERYGAMTESLCRLMDRAEQNGGTWTSPHGTPMQIAPQELVADYLQDYCIQLLETTVPGQYDAAEEALGKLVERETAYCPESPVACNNAAAWHYGQGRIQEALTWFVRASEAAPDDAAVIYNIGYLYAGQGDRENACKWWSRLLTVSDESYRTAAPELLRSLDRAAQTNESGPSEGSAQTR